MFIGNREFEGGQTSLLVCCPLIVLQKQTPGAVMIKILKRLIERSLFCHVEALQTVSFQDVSFHIHIIL